MTSGTLRWVGIDMAELARSKPFATVYGDHGGAAYAQGGRYFNAHGKEIEVPPPEPEVPTGEALREDVMSEEELERWARNVLKVDPSDRAALLAKAEELGNPLNSHEPRWKLPKAIIGEMIRYLREEGE